MKAKLTAYTSLVRPVLEYGSMVWDPSQKYQVDQLERIQRRAARFIMSDYRSSESVSEMLHKLKLPPLSQRRRVARLKFLYLMHHKYFNFSSELYLKPRSSRIVRSSHQGQFIPIMARINAYKYSFLPKTIEEWNLLPQEIVNAGTISQFEKSVLNHFSLETQQF